MLYLLPYILKLSPLMPSVVGTGISRFILIYLLLVFFLWVLSLSVENITTSVVRILLLTVVIFLSHVGFFYIAKSVVHRIHVIKQEKIEEELKDKRERAEESFAYANSELKIFVDALGGKSLGCSNYQSQGDLLPCSLVTEKGVILEVGCPSKQDMHGCTLTDNAYEILRSKGFDVTIGNSNSNSNENFQKPS